MTHSRIRVEVHPQALSAAAVHLEQAAHRITHSVETLRSAGDQVRLGWGDQRFDPVVFRQSMARLQTGLAAAQANALRDVEICRSTVAAAIDADNKPGLQCSIPRRYRQSIDGFLTKVVASGLRATSTEVLGFVEMLVGTEKEPEPALLVTPGTEDLSGAYTSRLVDSKAAMAQHDNIVGFGLAATADQSLIGNDEFGLIDHGDQKFTVILPGVSDLSQPKVGWDSTHRTVRDLDMVALESAGRNGIASNLYASMVAEGLIRNGVEPGATILLIGHSFGADTALDLASDPGFGERYNIAQVVATGYHSQPQVASVPDSINVLVVQNQNDLVIQAERLLPADTDGVFDCNAARPSPSTTKVIQFEGGLKGLGHDVAHYGHLFDDASELPEAQATAIGAAVLRVGSAGFAAPATMKAIDVSVPTA